MRKRVEVAPGRRCLAPGCERMVSRGEALCRDHRRTGWGKEVERALRQVMSGAVRAADGETERRKDGKAELDERDERERVREEFRRRVLRGEYGGLFDEPVRQILEQAAAEAGLDRELGALRLMLARLLMEDGDPVRQALGVTRVATAAARIVRTQAAVGGQRDTLQEWIHEVLRELDLAEREGRIPPRTDDGVGELPTYGLRALGEKALAGIVWAEEEEDQGVGR